MNLTIYQPDPRVRSLDLLPSVPLFQREFAVDTARRLPKPLIIEGFVDPMACRAQNDLSFGCVQMMDLRILWMLETNRAVHRFLEWVSNDPKTTGVLRSWPPHESRAA